MNQAEFISRKFDQVIEDNLHGQGVPEVVCRILAHRLTSDDLADLDDIMQPTLQKVPSPQKLLGMPQACQRLVTAIVKQQRIGILTDYDVDGITSHVIIYKALTEHFGFSRDFISHHIGHRIKDGYGISRGLVDRILAEEDKPDVIITADCGSSDHDRIARLKAVGIDVIVTDHHAIPDCGVPQEAWTTVNPTQKGCDYPDALIAGCMVAWLVMSGLRQALIEHQYLESDAPKLSDLLDLVSLGTVADAVSLKSVTNRAVVTAGLKLLNQQQRPAWQAMANLLNKQGQAFDYDDLGFQIGPRINARSRMADPFAALYFLLAPDQSMAMKYLKVLDEDNQLRKKTEKEMLVVATDMAQQQVDQGHLGLVIQHDDFHMGVQGIVASRLVEKFGRPCVVMTAAANPQTMTGSARTIEAIHIREILSAVDQACPGLMVGFGGHKGAAGLTIDCDHAQNFIQLFDAKVKSALTVSTLSPQVQTDGTLRPDQINRETYDQLCAIKPFGRGFMAPVFEGEFTLSSLRWVGKPACHLSLMLHQADACYKAIWFFAKAQPDDVFSWGEGDTLKLAYQLSVNYFRSQYQLQIQVVAVDQSMPC